MCTLYVSASTSVTGPVVTSLKSFLGMLPLLPFFLWNFTCFVLKRNRAVQIQIIDKMQALYSIENSMVEKSNTKVYSLQEFLSFAFLQKARLSASLRTFCPGLLKNMGWKFAKNCGMTTQISWPKSDSLLRSVPNHLHIRHL